jgi:hypothetical protein
MKRISAKLKPIFNDINLVRSVCLRQHITDVDVVIALMIFNADDKRYTIDNAIYNMKHVKFNNDEISKIITDYELSQYCKFDISYTDIKALENEPYFNERCGFHGLNANYIKDHEVI